VQLVVGIEECYRLTMRFNRRRALGGLSAAAVASQVGCGPALRAPQRLDLARQRVRNVVVLMMENRSFDHMFGGLSFSGARSDIDGCLPTMHNADLDGNLIAPYEAQNDGLCIPDPPHGWRSIETQLNGGANDGFLRAYQEDHGRAAGAHTMSFLSSSLLSTSHGLLDAGALCQRWFAGVPGPTWPNRYYLLLGESAGVKRNEFIETPVRSLFHALWDADVPWKNYYGNIPFGSVVEGFRLSDREVQPFEEFFADAEAGTLPAFSLIDPTYGLNDDHPPTHPSSGQLLLHMIYDALSRSPQWQDTMFVVTYDEHGGFFDHVPPPRIADDRADEGFGQMGVRVPAMVLGPWAKVGVHNTIYNHASVWRTLDDLWGIGITNKRIGASASLLDALDDDRLHDNTPAAPTSLAPLVVDQVAVDAPECEGTLFHGRWADTHQPELEALFLQRFPGQAEAALTSSSVAWRRAVAAAGDRGLWRKK
jgi:phospholipase C